MNRLMTMFYLNTNPATGMAITSNQLSAMNVQFQELTQAMNAAIFSAFTAMITTLLLVAIGVGVYKKMFVFGNPQAITAANKIILTAIIGSVVLAVILPLKEFVIEEMGGVTIEKGALEYTLEGGEKVSGSQYTVSSGPIEIKEGVTEGEQRYSAFVDAVRKIQVFSDNIYTALITITVAITVISIGIAVFRIKFSLGNAEVIADARRQIKMTIFAAFILISAQWGLWSWTTLVNKSDYANPISAQMQQTLSEIGKANLTSSASAGALNADSNIDQTWNKVKRAESPGLIVTVNYNEGENYENFKMPIDVERGETYSFESPKSGFKGVLYKNGVSTIRLLNENIMIFVFVNSGWKVAVSSNDGYSTIRVPRTDNYQYALDGGNLVRVPKRNKDGEVVKNEKKTEYSESLFKKLELKYPPIKNLDNIKDKDLTEGKDYVKLKEEDEFPLQDKRNAFMVFSTIAKNPGEVEKDAFDNYDFRESSVPFRYIGPLKYEKHQGDGQYQISFTFSEDDEDQKAFKRISLLGDDDEEAEGSGTVPVPSDYQYYILIDDISDEIASTPFLHDGVKAKDNPAEDIWKQVFEANEKSEQYKILQNHNYEKWITIDDATTEFKNKLWKVGQAMYQVTKGKDPNVKQNN